MLDAAEITPLFRLKGSVIPKAACWAIPSAGLAAVVHWALRRFEVDEMTESLTRVSNIWSSFTFILGVLIVFRTNQAYARFWEGATLLQQVRGEWFNASSSLLAFTSRNPDRAEQVRMFERQFVCLMSMLYCAGLQTVALIADDKLEIIDNQGVDPAALAFLRTGVDRCEVVLQWVQRLIVNAMDDDVVPIAPPVLSRVFQELSRGIVNIHNVRKIAEIPFPFPYTQMLTMMLVFQTLLTPALTAAFTPSMYWAASLTFIVVEAFWCMNYIASEIEQPFGEDLNDLPIPDMLKDMNKSLLTLLRAEVRIPPTYSLQSRRGDRGYTISCMAANYTSSNQSLVDGFAKSRSRTLGNLSGSHPGSSSGSLQSGASTSSRRLRSPFTANEGGETSRLQSWEEASFQSDLLATESPKSGAVPPKLSHAADHAAAPCEEHSVHVAGVQDEERSGEQARRWRQQQQHRQGQLQPAPRRQKQHQRDQHQLRQGQQRPQQQQPTQQPQTDSDGEEVVLSAGALADAVDCVIERRGLEDGMHPPPPSGFGGLYPVGDDTDGEEEETWHVPKDERLKGPVRPGLRIYGDASASTATGDGSAEEADLQRSAALSGCVVPE